MSRRLITVLVAVGALAVVVAGLLAGLVTGGANDPGTAVNRNPAGAFSPGATASGGVRPRDLRTYTADQAGAAFLHHYVDHGRVVRTDQGGDTVSEGQAYAMLIAVGVGDQAIFDSVWTWTQKNLQRPDRLLSWRWNGGAVVDPSSASDADLDTARALVLAGAAFGDPADTTDGMSLGQAVLDLETVQTGAGRILTAGQWAMTEPYSYNPSYVSPAATAVLARASGDPRWAKLDQGSRTVTASLLAKSPLPPDWAQVHADGRVEAMPGVQGRGQSVRYGYDATRTPIRFAESCDPADRALAAAMAQPLDRAGDAAVLDLGGSPMGDTTSVVAATAQAAAGAAAGDATQAATELVHADHLQQLTPTYYGGAWDALGRLLLTNDVLGGCPPAGSPA